MKRCRVPAYEGDQNYIYISHSLKDKRFVYPIIEQLAKDGYRVWFDEGIVCNLEAEVIADKISGCDVFLAFVSDNTVDLQAFKREINYAVLKKKKIIAVMLEDVLLSPGMEMQMAAFPAIFKYKIDTAEFFKKLYSFEIMNSCLGEANDSIIVSDEDEYRETLADLFGADERKGPVIDDAFFIKIQSEEEEIVPKAFLTKITTNEKIEISTPKMIIGRAVSEKNIPIVDYSIATNSMVSRLHAVILYKNKDYYLIDCGAVNKTYLNSEPLDINKECILHDGDIIKFANEKFRFSRTEV